MKYNCAQAANDVGYVVRYSDLGNTTHSTPYVYSSVTQMERPAGYRGSDLKDMYISREQLQSRMIAPEITQAELFSLRAK